MDYPFKVYITSDDVLKRGYSLSKRLRIDDQGTIEATIDAFLHEVAQMVYEYILKNFPHRDMAKIICTEEKFENDISICQLEQCIYVFENHNIKAISGLGQSTLLSLEDLRGDRAYADYLVQYVKSLKANLYGGIV